MGKFREKIEGWLAPENVRTGVPTYIPRDKKHPLPPIDEAAVREEYADYHEASEVDDEDARNTYNAQNLFVAQEKTVSPSATRYMGMTGVHALEFERTRLHDQFRQET